MCTAIIFIRLGGPKSATRHADSTFDVHNPGRIHLSRVPKASILVREQYEFYAGSDTNGQPVWSRDLRDKQPVFRDDINGVGWNLSVSYNPGLRRYILCTQHTENHGGNIGIYDAPEPWGPWTTVLRDNKWGAPHIEPTTWLWHFPTKWLSRDGTAFTMIFTGKHSNDSWNTVEGRFIRKPPPR